MYKRVQRGAGVPEAGETKEREKQKRLSERQRERAEVTLGQERRGG